MATQPGGSVTSRAASESRSGPSGHGGAGSSSGHVTGAKFRHGLLQLMIHTIDPLHDGISSYTSQLVSCDKIHSTLSLSLLTPILHRVTSSVSHLRVPPRYPFKCLLLCLDVYQLLLGWRRGGRTQRSNSSSGKRRFSPRPCCSFCCFACYNYIRVPSVATHIKYFFYSAHSSLYLSLPLSSLQSLHATINIVRVCLFAHTNNNNKMMF